MLTLDLHLGVLKAHPAIMKASLGTTEFIMTCGGAMEFIMICGGSHWSLRDSLWNQWRLNPDPWRLAYEAHPGCTVKANSRVVKLSLESWRLSLEL
jgi:hypothetical protein